MKVLHITPSTNGYEEVTLLANEVNETNNLYVIERGNVAHMSGGFIINDTPQIRAVLDLIPANEQFEFVKNFKMDPFVKQYYQS